METMRDSLIVLGLDVMKEALLIQKQMTLNYTPRDNTQMKYRLKWLTKNSQINLKILIVATKLNVKTLAFVFAKARGIYNTSPQFYFYFSMGRLKGFKNNDV